MPNKNIIQMFTLAMLLILLGQPSRNNIFGESLAEISRDTFGCDVIHCTGVAPTNRLYYFCTESIVDGDRCTPPSGYLVTHLVQCTAATKSTVADFGEKSGEPDCTGCSCLPGYSNYREDGQVCACRLRPSK